MGKIILFYGAGNHSNRLFQSIHYEAFCKEYGLKFESVCFENMKELYGIKKSFFAPVRKYVIAGLFKLKLLKGYRFAEESDTEKYQEELKNRRKSYCCGWLFRRNDLTEKYRKEFQSKYALKESFYRDNLFVEKVLDKKEDEVVVGIHLRRGDYKNWQGGKYYFENDTFVHAMDKMKEIQKKKGKKVKFLLFSNEKLDFTESDSLMISHEQWYIDQYLMSKCDYLIGPPSTFTGWASYIGEVPLYYIENKNPDLKLSDFRIING